MSGHAAVHRTTALHWIRTLLRLRPPLSPAQQRAADLVKAVDAGGVPLNPARVNQIAGHLDLPVSKTEAVGDTVKRIRAHLKAEGLVG
jgi:hypothetical protein